VQALRAVGSELWLYGRGFMLLVSTPIKYTNAGP
jgi:hypothetical protein